MKILIILSAFFCSFNSNLENSSTFFYQKKIDNQLSLTSKSLDTLNKKTPYKVVKSNPALKYSIRKIGNGNRVLFFVKNGFQSLPQVDFYKDSGVYYKIGKKEGFENVTFPFECSISSSVNYFDHGFDNRPSLLNDFEIVIYEPGNWEISFK